MARKRSISDVVGELFSGLSNLVRTEAELAQAEFLENVDRATKNVITVLIAGIILLPAMVLLLEGLALLLIRADVPDYVAYLIIAVVTAGICAAVILAAIKRLRKVSIIPRKTIHQLKRDAEVANIVRQDHGTQRAA